MRFFYLVALTVPVLSNAQAGCVTVSDCSDHGQCKKSTSDDVDHANDGSSYCDCDEDYYGLTCSNYCPIKCDKGKCEKNENQIYVCNCFDNWRGPQCDISVEKCPDGTQCLDGNRCVKSDIDDESDEQKDIYECETVGCPKVPDTGCSVCGPGYCVTDEDAIFEFPGQPAVPCNLLQAAGINGTIPLDQCKFLPSLVKEKCVCHADTPREIVSAPSPTPENGLDPFSVGCQSDNDCSNHGTCNPYQDNGDVDHANSATNSCNCDENYFGASCGRYCPIDCDQGSCREKDNGDYACSCKVGWGGPACDTSFETCPDDSRCSNGFRCVRSDDGDEADSDNDTYACKFVKCDTVPSDGCSICGPGYCVTAEKAIFEFPGQPSVPCGVLQEAGYTGFLPLDQCPFLPSLVKEKCVCHAASGPVTPFAPTPAPIRPPVRFPTRGPGSRGTPEPLFLPTPVDREIKTRSPSYVNSQNSGLSNGSIAGIVIGSCAALFLMILGGAKLWSRGSKKLPRDAATVGLVLAPDGTTTMKDITKIGDTNGNESTFNSNGAAP